jgi:DMSO/TMAO reductase YedYZ molybdopterin-dependent catalytic subunit
VLLAVSSISCSEVVERKLTSQLKLVSTALWTGVYLADIINYVKPIRPKAKYIIFEGADTLPNGPYGTSQRLSWASEKEKGMLIGSAFTLRLISPPRLVVNMSTFSLEDERQTTRT